jgi:hypothetical protein
MRREIISLIIKNEESTLDLIIPEAILNKWYYGISYLAKLENIRCILLNFQKFLWSKVFQKYSVDKKITESPNQLSQAAICGNCGFGCKFGPKLGNLGENVIDRKKRNLNQSLAFLNHINRSALNSPHLNKS